jgi:transposase
MKLHANAALSLRQRRRMVGLVIEQGWPIARAAAEFKTSSRTCSKWVARFREASESGLLDRYSAPELVANRTPQQRVEAIAALGRLRFTGPEIAELLEMPVSTVSGSLTRIGLGRLGRLGLEPAERYERDRPGELIHVDVKKLGRIQRGAGKRSATGCASITTAGSPTEPDESGRPWVGSSSMSRSTTPPAWPTPKCWPTRRPSRRSVFSLARSSTSPATA